MSNHQQLKVRAACQRALIAGLSLQMAALPVLAQQAPDQVEELKPVVITGSNIPTAETVGPSPVEVYTIQDIERKSARTIEQLVKQLPVAVGAGNFGVSRGNGGDGSASISLRGIPGGTLVLINGRRTAPVGFAGSFADLNAIPLAMVDRIEILKDGGSAIYGADAIAGVVNIILKKRVSGTEIDAYYGNTTESDAAEQRYSFVTGVTTEKSSVLIGGSYYEANALYSQDRDRSFPDPTDPRNTSGTSNPGRLRTTTPGPNGPPPGGVVYRGAPGTTGTDPSQYTAFNAATDRFPFGFFTPAIRPSERWSIFGNAEHQFFGENLKFFTEASYTRTISYNQLAPTPIFFQFLDTASSPGGIVIPANNPYNVFQTPMDRVQYRVLERGVRTDTIFANVFRFLGGFGGRIGESSWNWETALVFGEDNRLEVLGGELSRRALEAAVADTNPATAFNPFGNRANTAAQLDGISQDLFTSGRSTLFMGDVRFNGNIVDLPGGPLAAFFGGEHRQERGDSLPDGPQRRNDTVGFNTAQPFSGKRDVYSAFGEVRVPITGPSMDIPGLYSLELNLAARYENYSDFGDSFDWGPDLLNSKLPLVPKIMLRWQPIDETLTLRFAYSESFRAPTFSDLYTPAQQSFPELRNPVKFAAGDPTAFEQVNVTIVGNPDLLPETAENYTAGLVYTPPFIKRLTVELNWFRIEQENVPDVVDQFILDENFKSGGPTNPNARFANLITFDPATSTYVKLITPTLNLSRRNIEGLDTVISYEIPTETAGTFTAIASAAYYYRFMQESIPGTGFEDRLGDFRDPGQGFGLGTLPRYKATGALFWAFRGFEFGVNVNYIHGFKDDVQGGFDRDVDSFISADLQASYRFPYDTKLTVGVINVTDEEPPLVRGAFADNYDRDTHDLRQRFVYVALNKKF